MPENWQWFVLTVKDNAGRKVKYTNFEDLYWYELFDLSVRCLEVHIACCICILCLLGWVSGLTSTYDFAAGTAAVHIPSLLSKPSPTTRRADTQLSSLIGRFSCGPLRAKPGLMVKSFTSGL